MSNFPPHIKAALKEKVDDAASQVWKSVVRAYEDVGLHKVQAYKQAQQVTDDVTASILAKLTQEQS
jgi:DNA-binding ferritin-like protein